MSEFNEFKANLIEILKKGIENKDLKSKLEMLEPENILLKLENEFFSNRYDKIANENKELNHFRNIRTGNHFIKIKEHLLYISF